MASALLFVAALNRASPLGPSAAAAYARPLALATNAKVGRQFKHHAVFSHFERQRLNLSAYTVDRAITDVLGVRVQAGSYCHISYYRQSIAAPGSAEEVSPLAGSQTLLV